MALTIREVLDALTRHIIPEPEPPGILIYADHPEFLGEPYKSTILQEVLCSGKYRVEIDQRRKLTRDELARHHEVWFFLASEGREERDALTADEVSALREWMDRGGGVLITGDHANGPKGAHEGLGAAVGMSVPRARHMRVWDCEPGMEDGVRIHNSTSTGDPRGEKDRVPQRLILPLPRHDLFPSSLQYLPDHHHEGRVLEPSMEQGACDEEMHREGQQEWGENPPKAQVIAKGVDWTHGYTFDLMAAWDGDSVGVGRILADASWHHYVDHNLQCIREPERSNILGLYVRQAYWLLPKGRRAQRLARALRAALESPRIIDYKHSSIRELGEDGLVVLHDQLCATSFAELWRVLVTAMVGADELPAGRDFRVHFVGALLRHLRAALVAGESLVETSIADSVLGEALQSYHDELTRKMETISSLQQRLSNNR